MALDFSCIKRVQPMQTMRDGLDATSLSREDAFMLPRVADPAAFCSARFDTYKGDTHGEHKMKFAKGTTTLAFKFKGGVIVSVDSRSTQGPYVGAYLASSLVAHLDAALQHPDP